MRECWERKAQIAAEYPTWEAYRAHQREDRKRLEAEGWKFVSPEDLPPPQKLPESVIKEFEDLVKRANA
jgi:hypothetical protein